MTQANLFDTPLIPGLAYRENMLDAEEEKMLIRKIDALPLTPFRFQGWTGKRLTLSLGWTYDFENGRFGPSEPIPPWLAPIKARAASFAGIADADLVQALLIRYDPGAGIGWHRDRPVFEHVVGISLGSATTLRFRKRTAKGFDRLSAPVAPRSIYHLSGEARHQWEHSIAGMDTRRWSITFRSLSAKGAEASRT
ncbi:MAG TPA: alpha-ketoglutarate-dependent dioxygenase AlkB [Sphingobium sp.]|nr:alpha-ketoglutarate-dependent dioxygenase AlkB [Sphingobium sp.]